jgi:hypothetical protein
LNAKESAYSDIKVEEGAKMTVDGVQAYFSSGLEASNGFSDGITEIVAAVSSMVNQANCLDTPDCERIGRKNCSTVSGTCGECLNGYIGETGSSNDRCFYVGYDLRRAQAVNFEECDSNNICTVASKGCPMDCSGHGECRFVSPQRSNITFEECTLIDFHCVAKCFCNEGFAGSFCDLSDTDFLGLQQTRNEIVQAIGNVSKLDDATAETLHSWLQGLSEVCNNADGLLEETKHLISKIAVELLDSAKTLELPYETISSISKTLELVLSALVSGDGVAPADLLNSYAAFIASDMVQGQNAVTIASTSYRLATFAFDGLGNTTFQTPQSAIEANFEQIPQSVILPASTTNSGFKVSLIELLVPTVNSHSFLSNPLGLRFDDVPCDNRNGRCSMSVTLQHNIPNGYGEIAVNVTSGLVKRFKCGNEMENLTSVCPDGRQLKVMCNGTSGIYSYKCPTVSISKMCLSIGRDESSCVLVSQTATNVTCECTFPTLLLSRKLQTENDDSEVSVDFATAGVAILDEFTATWISVDDLTAAQVIGSWEVLLTISLIAVIGVVTLLVASEIDKKDSKGMLSISHVAKLKDRNATTVSLLADSKMRRRVVQGHNRAIGEDHQRRIVDDALRAALPSVLQPTPLWVKYKAELKLYHRWAGIYFHYSKSYSRPLRLLSLLTNIIIFIFVEALTYDLRDPDDGQCELEESYDSCLSEKSTLSSGESKCFWDEETKSCHIRDIVNDLTQVLTVAIFAAMIGTPLAVAVQSLVQKYLAPATDSNRRVVPADQLDNNLRNYLHRSVSSFYSISPEQLVPAGISSTPSRRRALFSSKSKSGSTVLPVHTVGLESDHTANPTIRGKSMAKSSFEELPQLFSELRQFRTTLDSADRRVFDRVWGLENEMMDGNLNVWDFRLRFYRFGMSVWKFIVNRVKKTTSRSANLILLDNLKQVHATTVEELSFFDSKFVSNAKKNRRLMYLFVKDLLGSTNNKILESKEKRDNSSHPRVSVVMKTFVWGIISIFLGGMLFYVYLFAMRQTASRQAAWFKTFAIWLLFEIVLVSFAIVFLTHVIIPSYILNDAKRVREKVVSDICAFKSKIDERIVGSQTNVNDTRGDEMQDIASNEDELFIQGLEKNHDFNSAKYLYVSNRVAKMFPRLPVSGSIISYSTHWPQHSLTEEKRLSDNYSTKMNFIGQAASKVVYFLLLGLVSVPEPLQDCLIELVSASGLGYCTIFLVKLYRISPFIVAVPVVLLAVCIHFIINTSRHSTLLPKEEMKTPRLSRKSSEQTDVATNGVVNSDELTCSQQEGINDWANMRSENFKSESSVYDNKERGNGENLTVDFDLDYHMSVFM